MSAFASRSDRSAVGAFPPPAAGVQSSIIAITASGFLSSPAWAASVDVAPLLDRMRGLAGILGDPSIAYPLSLLLLVLALLAALRSRRPTLSIALAIALWLLWAFGAMALFHLGVAATVLTFALPAVPRIVDRIAPRVSRKVSPLALTILTEGARILLVIATVGLLGWLWRKDLAWLALRSPWVIPMLTGALRAAAILLVAVSVWRVLRRFIEDKLTRLEAPEDSVARLGTLLPILSNLLLAVIATAAILMALKEFGVEIGPLLASAGVVGVALGFGAQTLVKDIISGAFYILDDAFRIGEYIEAGAHKGTVESFSLRSVKLRHQRGALSTVPFGSLGAVRNMSRDWVIDKFTINVPYDTDLAKVKKIVRDIGIALAADPEFAPAILEPMKLQGIERFGNFAIELRIKMKTRPGRQFAIRRRALSMIRAAFEENGIPFAVPNVTVAPQSETDRNE